MTMINVNLSLHLGKRLIQVGDKVLGICDDVTIHVAEATPEEIIKLKNAQVINLVKPKVAHIRSPRVTEIAD